MTLQNQIQCDMTAAIKSGNHESLSVLRMLKAAVMKYEVSGKEKKEANDETVQQIIMKEIKQRQDSVTQYAAGNRLELAAKEAAEIKILEKYLPAQMGEEEIKKIVDDTIKQTGAKSKTDMGKVMGALMPKVKGKADGTLVNRIVQEFLV
mgnify:FL=1